MANFHNRILAKRFFQFRCERFDGLQFLRGNQKLIRSFFTIFPEALAGKEGIVVKKFCHNLVDDLLVTVLLASLSGLNNRV